MCAVYSYVVITHMGCFWGAWTTLQEGIVLDQILLEIPQDGLGVLFVCSPTPRAVRHGGSLPDAVEGLAMWSLQCRMGSTCSS